MGRVGDGIEVQVTVVNNGTRQGTEVVQVYVRAPESLVRRPDRELVAFAKVTVDAGGSETVRLPLGAAVFRYWDVDAHAWRSDPGRYELLVGRSSHDIWASTEIMWERHAGVVTERPCDTDLGPIARRAAAARGHTGCGATPHWSCGRVAVCVGVVHGQTRCVHRHRRPPYAPMAQPSDGLGLSAVTWVGHVDTTLVLVDHGQSPSDAC